MTSAILIIGSIVAWSASLVVSWRSGFRHGFEAAARQLTEESEGS